MKLWQQNFQFPIHNKFGPIRRKNTDGNVEYNFYLQQQKLIALYNKRT